MGVFGGCQDTAMAKDLLYFEQVDAGFDQMSGIAMAQAMQGNLFFIPQALTTLRMVVCTPPRSRGVVAVWLPFSPPLRLGNNNTGLRCTNQNRRSNSRVVFGSGTKRSLFLIPFGVTDMNTLTSRINISNLQTQSFAKA